MHRSHCWRLAAAARRSWCRPNRGRLLWPPSDRQQMPVPVASGRTHRAECARRPLFRHKLAGELEECDRLLAADRWEVVEESLQTVTGGQVVEQRSGGYTRAAEDGQAAHDVGRALDDVEAFT